MIVLQVSDMSIPIMHSAPGRMISGGSLDTVDLLEARLGPGLYLSPSSQMPPTKTGGHSDVLGPQVSMLTWTLCPTVLEMFRFLSRSGW